MVPLYAELPPVKVAGRKLVGRVVFALLLVASALGGALGGLLIVYSTDLPQVTELERYRPSAITEIYDDQGRVVGSFALQRRIIAGYDDYAPVLRDALLSIEDKDFFSHWGVDFWRVFGAAYQDIKTGSRAQGASTLTMQLARNLFLSPDRTWTRKVQEVMLAIQIERRFTKQQIFTMYANQIFLGHGVYGFEAGAQFYFGKPSKELTLEEAAVLAGLPKAPNSYSPIHDPERSLGRRNLVINAMLEDGKITVAEATRAKEAPLLLNVQTPTNSLAPHFVEEIRQYLERKYGSDEVHMGGLRVYTTLDLDLQKAATRAVLDGLAAYERRHGWRGGLQNVRLAGATVEDFHHPDWDQPPEAGSYTRALVVAVSRTAASLRIGRYTAALSAADMAWTGRRSPQELFAAGDLAYVRVVGMNGDELDVMLEQEPQVEGALVAMDNATGDVKAMVGGRDFRVSKFNRATQALRQVGSSFKPYVYTAAIDGGAVPDDLIMDEPTSFPTASGPYIPRNYDGKFEGVITLRRALAQSRNIPTLKLAERLTIERVIEYARRFGITSRMPSYLPVALGSGEVTLMEQTAAFATFPSDGVRPSPRYIRKVEDYEGWVLEENFPEVRDAVNARTARIMTSMLQGVVQAGTARAALSLKHPLGGKTGTTNDYTDAWFIGFSPSLTCGVWLGFDEKKTLGRNETGSVAALPIWIGFMRVALKGREGEEFPSAPPAPASVVRGRWWDRAAPARRVTR